MRLARAGLDLLVPVFVGGVAPVTGGRAWFTSEWRVKGNSPTGRCGGGACRRRGVVRVSGVTVAR